MRLIPCSQSDSVTYHLYLHGFSSAVNSMQEQRLIREIKQHGADNAYLVKWESGDITSTLTQSLLRDTGSLGKGKTGLALFMLKKVVDGVNHFHDVDANTQQVARALRKHLLEWLPITAKVNVIAHSLGTKVAAELISIWPDDRLQHWYCLGGALPIQSDWASLCDRLSGDIVNYWSKKDWVLLMKPSTEKSIGRCPIIVDTSLQARIHNQETGFSHSEYWKNLDLIPLKRHQQKELD